MELSREEIYLIRFLKSIGAEEKDIICIALLLKTEDNFRDLNEWMSVQEKAPTLNECLKKAVVIAGVCKEVEDETKE